MLLTNNIRVFKSGSIIWAGHMALMEERQVHTDVWCGNMKRQRPIGRPSVNGSIILKRILNK
jgi:hypothetical protein